MNNNNNIERRQNRQNCYDNCPMPNRHITQNMTDADRNAVQAEWNNWNDCYRNCLSQFPYTNNELAMMNNGNFNNVNNAYNNENLRNINVPYNNLNSQNNGRNNGPIYSQNNTKMNGGKRNTRSRNHRSLKMIKNRKNHTVKRR
jgi:hypothetical protein